MKIVVLKFGGTSVGTIQKIKKIAEIITEYKKKDYKVVVVSSAMSGATNELIKKSKEISKNFSESEYDALVSSGEQMACSLIAGRLIHKGYKSRSWTAWQIPILTQGSHKNSRIIKVNKIKITKLAWETRGTRSVKNAITIKGLTNFKSTAKDILITGQLRSALIFNKNTKSRNYTLETINKKIYIFGIAMNEDERKEVINEANKIYDVEEIFPSIYLATELSRNKL